MLLEFVIDFTCVAPFQKGNSTRVEATFRHLTPPGKKLGVGLAKCLTHDKGKTSGSNFALLGPCKITGWMGEISGSILRVQPRTNSLLYFWRPSGRLESVSVNK